MGVSQIMYANLWQLEPFKPREEITHPNVLVMKGLPAWAAEDETIPLKLWSSLQFLLHLPATELPQGVNNFRRQRHGTPRAVSLWLPKLRLAPRPLERLSDMEEACLEVQVRRREAKQLSQPHFALGNWTDQGARNVKETVKRADAFVAAAEKMNIKVHNILYTMGPHDIVSIIEAPNDRAASALALSVGTLGNVRSVTMPAYTKDEMAGILRELP